MVSHPEFPRGTLGHLARELTSVGFWVSYLYWLSSQRGGRPYLNPVECPSREMRLNTAAVSSPPFRSLWAYSPVSPISRLGRIKVWLAGRRYYWVGSGRVPHISKKVNFYTCRCGDRVLILDRGLCAKCRALIRRLNELSERAQRDGSAHVPSL